jgi:hypothetical protein
MLPVDFVFKEIHGAVRALVAHGTDQARASLPGEGEYTAFLTRACRNLATFSFDGLIHFVCMDWRHLDELLAAGRDAYGELINLCVWT